MVNKLKKRLIIFVIIILILLFGGFLGAGIYFYHVAVVPSQKPFLSKPNKLTKTDPLYQEKRWFLDTDKKQWQMHSATDNFNLVADYIPAAEKTNKTAIVAHGFMQSKAKMGEYAFLFHHLGYNVLLPDARGHGQSTGHYIGYGWPDRLDYQKWINKVIQTNGKDSKIVMFGVSMGGATTMMTSGQKLPTQVKAFIEDCGYTNAKAEINYQAGQLYHLPAWIRVPLVNEVSVITRIRAGYYFGEASSTKQLAHNQRPMLFIHGSNDQFVPTKMVYENYHATKGPKQLWIVKGAGHANSFKTNPTGYTKHITEFVTHYVK